MPIKPSTFNLYEGNTLVMTGTEPEIKKQLGLDGQYKLPVYIYKKANLCGKYRVEYNYCSKHQRDYDIYKDGVFLFRGTRNDIMEKLKIQFRGSPSSYASTNSKLHGYTIKFADDMEHNEMKPNKHEEKLNYFVKHLTDYGNTVSLKNPKPWLKELKEMGLEVIVRKRFDKHEGHGKDKVDDVFYILELKK